MSRPKQPEYGDEWTLVTLEYKDVTLSLPHCPFCGVQVDSYQMGDYPDQCDCGRWYDGAYKKDQTKAEKQAELKAKKEKAKRTQEKREMAIYKKVKKRLQEAKQPNN